MKKETNAQNRKLKRLAKSYAVAYADLTWMGNAHPDDWDEIEKRHREARKRLFDAINAATLIPF